MTSPMETELVISRFTSDGTADISWEVTSFSFMESLNQPFILMLYLTTDNRDAEPVRLLGQPAKLTLTRGSVMRQVTGIVSEVHEGSNHDEMVTASIEVVPALEALRHRVNTKIFQEMTVPEILEQVLGESLGGWNRRVDNRLSRTYPTCEYRVQYNESDFTFCQRLMEEEGIVYLFDFEDESEVMVLADAASEWGTIESLHGVALDFSLQEDQVGGHEHVTNFHGRSQLVPTKVATRHFDWTHPSVPIEGENADAADLDRPHGGLLSPEREIYEQDEHPLTLSEYDGAAFGANDGDDQSRLRRESQAWKAFVCEGESTVLGMTVGSIFELSGHPLPEFYDRYLVVSVSHVMNEGGATYYNDFECLPETVPFRPRRATRRPRISSIQTATVVGPAGEEIHTDEHGRVKVQFHWDRLGAKDESSSCWIRVMQPWAGAGWGHVFIPRIGMEVSVGFVDGDPDRPLVIGSVYNAEHPPPNLLPDEKTKSTIKTETSLGGGGYNELRFEDKAGSEEIFIHAQKDYNEIVENDHTLTVHNDETITVDNDQVQSIGNDQTEHVMNNQALTVDANRTIQVHGNFEETIDGSETRTVSSGVTETIAAGETRTVTGGMTEDISGGRTQTINGDSTESITGALTQDISAGAAITTPASYDITAVGGFKMSTPASITIIAPGGFNLIAPGGNQSVDSGFFKFGANHWWNFFFDFSSVGAKTELCGILNLGVNGIHIENVGAKATTGLTNLSHLTNKLNTEGLKLKSFGACVKLIATRPII
jgi:type VI secretion system secreted protein VgrG